MNVEELQAVLDCLVTARNRDTDLVVLECNYCNDITYVDDLYSEDFAGIASSLLGHIWQRHPEKVKPPVEPVTQEEIDEVFGLSRRE